MAGNSRRKCKSGTHDWNWHNATGFWSTVPLLVIVSSGVVMSFGWANDLLYRTTGSEVPKRGEPERTTRQPRHAGSREGLNALWKQAEEQAPNWKSVALRVPGSEQALVGFTIDRGNGGRPDLRSQLTLDRTTGRVVRWETFSSYSAGRRLRGWLRFLHTGELGGVAGETIAAIATLGATFLVWTGLAMAFRRWATWRLRSVQRVTR